MLSATFETFFTTDAKDIKAIDEIVEQLAKASAHAPDTLARIMDAWLDVTVRMVDAPGQAIAPSAVTATTIGRSCLAPADAYRLVLLLANPGMGWTVPRYQVGTWFAPHHRA
jgi:hypothetical protein